MCSMPMNLINYERSGEARTMSAPLIYNRSWNRAMYYAMRKLTRRIWWENKCDAKVEKALNDCILYGYSSTKVVLLP